MVQNAFLTGTKDLIGIREDEEIKFIKNSEIPIMDLVSTGSVLSKKEATFFYKRIMYLKRTRRKR